jgi:hypothetical protein
MIWNSDLSAKVGNEVRLFADHHNMRRHTFRHLHVIRNERYIILYFEARMPRIFEDKVSGACIGQRSLQCTNW